MARSIALLLAVAGALLWAMIAAMPPAPVGVAAAPTVFSAMRAFADVAAIARHPHPIGSTEDAKVRAYLAARLKALGADVSEQPVPLDDKSIARLSKFLRTDASGTIGHNVIGIVHGRDPRLPALLLMAHHDTVVGSPGAADDTIGIATALEALRAIEAQGPPLRDIVLVFTDGEEMGLDGSKAFFASHPLAKRVGVMINMEARGGGGRANMFETGANNGGFMQVYAASVKRPASNSLSILVYDLMPNSTDYTIAKKRGVAGFNFAILGRGWAYHSPLATPAALDKASLQDMGDQVLALSRSFAYAGTLPTPRPNATFADILGRTTLLYPAAGGWVIVVAAMLLIGLAFWRLRPAPGAVGGGAIVTIALISHAALLLTAINAVSGSSGADYYDRLAALPRLEIQAALAIAAMLLLVPIARRREIRLMTVGPALAAMWVGLLFGSPLAPTLAVAAIACLAAWFLPHKARGGGAILLLLVATIAVQATLPTAALLLAAPLLLASIAMAARAFLPAVPSAIITMALAIVGLGHLAGQAHFIFLGVGAELPLTMALLLLPALPLLWPLLPERTPLWLPTTLLAAALVIALWVRLDPIAPSVPTYDALERTKTKA